MIIKQPARFIVVFLVLLMLIGVCDAKTKSKAELAKERATVKKKWKACENVLAVYKKLCKETIRDYAVKNFGETIAKDVLDSNDVSPAATSGADTAAITDLPPSSNENPTATGSSVAQNVTAPPSKCDQIMTLINKICAGVKEVKEGGNPKKWLKELYDNVENAEKKLRRRKKKDDAELEAAEKKEEKAKKKPKHTKKKSADAKRRRKRD